MLAALLAATLAAYQPAWHGGLVWDDEAHVTRPELRSLDGLARIWVEPGATQQYYPLLHSTFWVLHRLFGDNTLPYHLLSITLHALSAFLFALILRRPRGAMALARGVRVRAASGARGVGGVDHRTEEHAVRRVLPRGRALVSPVR